MTKNRPLPKEAQNDVDRALVQTVMFEHGILPMEKTHLDMRRALSQLPPDEARKLRRKFRKLWRKAMHEQIDLNQKGITNTTRTRVKNSLGVGKNVPSRAERTARKQLVFDTLWKQHIAPVLAAFERGNAPPKT